jgi:TDG/mug DNA glycosylase family protein
MILPDLLAPGLDLVLCGTAPSRISMQRAAYYANPGNRFWLTLAEIGLTAGRLAPTDYGQLLGLGIGLTDLNKTEFGTDAQLTPVHFDGARFAAEMRRFRPAAIAFSSKNAGKNFLNTRVLSFGRQDVTLDGIPLFVLPSPSGLARRSWSIEPWREVGRFVAERRRARGTADGQT